MNAFATRLPSYNMGILLLLTSKPLLSCLICLVCASMNPPNNDHVQSVDENDPKEPVYTFSNEEQAILVTHIEQYRTGKELEQRRELLRTKVLPVLKALSINKSKDHKDWQQYKRVHVYWPHCGLCLWSPACEILVPQQFTFT